MANLVKKQTGAAQVFIVSHITRNEAEAAEGKRLGAHRLVHNDFTPNFKQTLNPLLDENGSTQVESLFIICGGVLMKMGWTHPLPLRFRTVSEKKFKFPTDLFNYGKEGEKNRNFSR
ncbi:MAG: hypothetical protein Ct9H90mP7_1690 [Candidatus Neomarinimicrobiota bacterium]|nr:MAG: hypothetical protein Ct9H90mP7_1690 [Candidatus Neomarinimicrobiota bacterium]